ncbi:MAG: chemotaxis response regulator protein-glutamate methylesterase [Cyclobacteriaceae bacterium]
MGRKIKILIVDDSQLVRQALADLIAEDDHMEVMAVANDPYEAVQILRHKVPDVITLDVEMPKMNGITFLKKLMSQHPIPVVVISTLTKSGTAEALKALEYGAVEVMHKPNMSTGKELERNGTYIRSAIRAASLANVKLLNKRLAISRRNAALEKAEKASMIADRKPAKNIIAIGASTGGTEAIKSILMQMGPDSPGVVIVQHMPAMFTGQFAQRLNVECPIEVKEAAQNDKILPGRALIAPGNQHMEVRRTSDGFSIRLNESELVNRHRPSVDVLFHSVAEAAKSKAVGALLTGMGKDGAKGLLVMKQAGAETIAQNEASCVVFGMPKEAINIGAASKVLSLDETGKYLGRIKNSD